MKRTFIYAFPSLLLAVGGLYEMVGYLFFDAALVHAAIGMAMAAMSMCLFTLHEVEELKDKLRKDN